MTTTHKFPSQSEEAEEGELDENANLPDKKAQPNIKFRSLIQVL